MEKGIAIFNGREIRRSWSDNEWWFSVVDVIFALTDSSNSRDYWYKMKIRVKTEEGAELSTFCRQLKLESADGKKYETDCANTEGIFRIIQSIPSPKAEPFKLWLAKVGYDRVQEIENPELAAKRMREIYQAKGYSEEWIEKRLRGIAVRDELTAEWRKRKVKEGREFAILTAEIAKAALGVTPTEHKQLKNLKRENLRDHMTDLELIFSMLGEAATTEITRVHDAKGFDQNQHAARSDGEVAGKARKDLEQKTGKRVVSRENYLTIPEKAKKLKSVKK